ncbi:uncharacterized protein isoform X2 [Rhodnius prolixus]|uniref:uncharacterized protein isoform X2 n=1 Tax=Rhodnius prolixus TaxID=13249 RepID=UPI003D189095
MRSQRDNANHIECCCSIVNVLFWTVIRSTDLHLSIIYTIIPSTSTLLSVDLSGWKYCTSRCTVLNYRSEWLRSLPIYQRFRNYFPSRLIKTADLPSSKNYIICAFPHGILCTSVFSQFLSENKEFQKLFPGIEVSCHTLNPNFYFPFSREYVLSIGFCSVSKEALVHQLSKPGGRAVCLVVGGSAEAMISYPGTHRIIAKNRKGFIKLALTTGSDLVPVYSFGETDLYNQWIFPENSLLYKIQQAVRKFTGIAPVLFLGRGIFQNHFGLLPYQKPINMVVGKPIVVEKVINPTKNEINDLHERFIQELIALFEEHKHKYVPNPEKSHLSIED